jgi:hypothetical protein
MVDRRLGREERVASLIRVGELELTGENEAEVDAYFAPEFIFHGPDGADLDYARPSAWYSRRKPSNRRRWPSSSWRISVTMSWVTGSTPSLASMMRL